MAPPTNVIFDVGNVLLRWAPAEIIEELVPEADTRAVLRATFDHEDWQLLDHGRLTEDEAVVRFMERTHLTEATVRELMLASKSRLEPMPLGLNLLEELHRLGVQLYCLTNMSHRTYAYLRDRFEFFQRFRNIVVSAEVGLIKPQIEIFQHALATFRIAAADSAFVDDSPRNVASAAAAGIRARVFDETARDWLLSGAP